MQQLLRPIGHFRINDLVWVHSKWRPGKKWTDEKGASSWGYDGMTSQADTWRLAVSLLSVLPLQCDGHASDKIDRQWFTERERQIALHTSIPLQLPNERDIFGDRRVDANVLLERGEIEENALALERWHVVTDAARCIR